MIHHHVKLLFIMGDPGHATVFQERVMESATPRISLRQIILTCRFEILM